MQSLTFTSSRPSPALPSAREIKEPSRGGRTQGGRLPDINNLYTLTRDRGSWIAGDEGPEARYEVYVDSIYLNLQGDGV